MLIRLLLTAVSSLPLLLIIPVASAQVAGFDRGNVFQYRPAYGEVSVSCPAADPGVPSYITHSCYGYSFSPATSAHFVGPRVAADEVELVSRRADGTIEAKSSDYGGSRGVSTDAFNLWIETFYQRPLLRLGRNDVHWTLKRRGRPVQSGHFLADVLSPSSLTCPRAHETSWDGSRCRSARLACDDYFARHGRLCR